MMQWLPLLVLEICQMSSPLSNAQEVLETMRLMPFTSLKKDLKRTTATTATTVSCYSCSHRSERFEGGLQSIYTVKKKAASLLSLSIEDIIAL
jgi:hypothetical protein